MKTILLSLVISSFLSIANAGEKPRFPASLECSSKTTVALQELVYKLNVDDVIKQSRYAKMMNFFSSAADCEVVNEIMLSAISDCTVKALKKANCK